MKEVEWEGHVYEGGGGILYRYNPLRSEVDMYYININSYFTTRSYKSENLYCSEKFILSKGISLFLSKKVVKEYIRKYGKHPIQ